MGLNHIGKKAIIALREPSLGPCFGIKGGATGGGYAQVLPPERINLHFTGDFHAITSAHNLIAAQLDNYIFQNRAEGSGLKNILWRRVMDMNDRSLRQIVTGLGDSTTGFPRKQDSTLLLHRKSWRFFVSRKIWRTWNNASAVSSLHIGIMESRSR